MTRLHMLRAMLAAAALATALCPSSAQPVLVDFEHRADGTPLALAAESDLWNDDVRQVLAGYGIRVSDLSHPDLALRIGRHANAQPASGGNTFFGWAGGGTAAGALPIHYRLVFDRPVSDFGFARAGLAVGASSKAWDLRAFDARGTELARVGENLDASSGWDGHDWSLRSFMLPVHDIAWVEVHSNAVPGASTYLSPPLDDLRFVSAPVPEPQTWALMALGGAALALRRHLRARRHRRPALALVAALSAAGPCWAAGPVIADFDSRQPAYMDIDGFGWGVGGRTTAGVPVIFAAQGVNFARSGAPGVASGQLLAESNTGSLTLPRESVSFSTLQWWAAGWSGPGNDGLSRFELLDSRGVPRVVVAAPQSDTWQLLRVDLLAAGFAPGEEFAFRAVDQSSGAHHAWLAFDDLRFGNTPAVPEPASVALLGCGLAILLLRWQRRHPA